MIISERTKKDLMVVLPSEANGRIKMKDEVIPSADEG